MTCSTSYGCYTPSTKCPDLYGCTDVCPDFVIRRGDTRPNFKVKVEDCDGPLDLTDLVLEATMWAKAKIKTEITADDDFFGLADNVGFNQVMVGDIILMDRPRMPEKMLVVAFDEINKLIQVQRGYHGTTSQIWAKGTPIKIIKFMDASAQTEMIYQDVLELNGTTTSNVLFDSFLVYEWRATDTCLPGCYFMEFKLIKMNNSVSSQATEEEEIIPSFSDPNLTPADFGCGIGSNIEWIRRFPADSCDGFIIKITNSFTSEEL